MAAISLTDVSGLLKTAFVGPINSAISKKVWLLKQLQWTNKWRIKGSKTVQHPIQLVRSTSVGFRNASSDGLPPVTHQETVQATTTLKILYAYTEFYGDTLRVTAEEPGAFASAFKTEIGSLIQSIRIETNRALYMAGTGVLGQVASLGNGSGTNDRITVRTSASQSVPPNMRWFEKGMHIDIINPATGSSRITGTYSEGVKISVRNKTSYTIDVVDPSTGNSVDLSGVNVTAGDYIVVFGNYNKEPYGLDAICDDGTNVSSFLNISETTYDRWKAYVQDVSWGQLTETHLQNLLDEIEDYDGQILLVCDKKVRNKIARLVKSTMVQPQTLDLKGGFKAISYGDYTIYADRYAPYGQLFGINLNHIIPHQLNASKDNIFKAFDFADIDGKVLHPTRNADIYYAKGSVYYNFTTNQRNAFGKISNIDPTA